MANEMINRARGIVRNYIGRTLDKTDEPVEFDVYVVWFSKTLQNWKALVSTTLPDSMYYEVTFNGDQDEAYLDAYRKVDNIKIGAVFDDAQE
jgi:hypothetical protein